MKVLMAAAHGGFGSENVPLGGGAAVFERLCGHWCDDNDLRMEAVGAGPHSPVPGLEYHQLAPPAGQPAGLGIQAYARFCREFGQAVTSRALETRPDLVLTHDVSEGPQVAVLREAGIPTATIFHVDVVDIFRRLYLASLPSAPWLTRFYRRHRARPWPGVLRLVFEKQQTVMEHSALCIVPSSGAARLLGECYPDCSAPVETIGWGAPEIPFTEEEVSRKARQLRDQYGLDQESRVLLTLSRLSPEKAQHRLLQAVHYAEKRGTAPEHLVVVIAGTAAFMRGEQHERRLKRMAESLRTPVIFPGHVGGLEKAGWYRSADLFVVNSLHESYGLTTLEAMQQGCPVVAVESFGTADTVSPEVGRLVAPGRHLEQRLWQAIENLLHSPQREDLAEAAKNLSSERRFSKAAEQLKQSLLKAASV